LRAALKRASMPQVSGVTAHSTALGNGNGGEKSATPHLRIRGRNLLGENCRPSVRIAGEDVPIIEASEHELVVAPLAHQTKGDLIVETDQGVMVAVKLDAPPSQPTGGPP
jgi:hypothetical protein